MLAYYVRCVALASICPDLRNGTNFTYTSFCHYHERKLCICMLHINEFYAVMLFSLTPVNNPSMTPTTMLFASQRTNSNRAPEDTLLQDADKKYRTKRHLGIIK